MIDILNKIGYFLKATFIIVTAICIALLISYFIGLAFIAFLEVNSFY